MANLAADVRRMTREEYHRLGEEGFFPPNKRVELINGIVYEMPPQDSWHSGTICAAQEVLQRVFTEGFVLRIQMPLALDLWSEPEPDLAVVAGHWRDYLSAHPETAVLAVEVSFSSIRLDREEKRLLYAAAGIPEYWILYVKTKQLEVLREPQDGDYRSRKLLKPGEQVAPVAAPGSSIQVADLLP
ncbi:MAG TPA: Uma2 family endonuclease [Thermoanaerobaculia bacterium]|nr:Uma2 family endonuclease [Thermoanaerobaculia bacterium]